MGFPKLFGNRVNVIGVEVNVPHMDRWVWAGLLFVIALIGLPVGLLAVSPEWREEARDVWREWRRQSSVITEIQKNPQVPVPVPAKKPQAKSPPPPAVEKPQPVPKQEPKPEIAQTNPPRTYRSLKRGGWDVWKEFELGTEYTNAASAFKALEAKHVDVTRAAKEKLRQKMSKVVHSRTLAIAQITVSELGFTHKPYLSEILERARTLRLREVPFDAMPLVAMEYTGNRNLFFGTRVLAGENEDRLAMVVSDSEYEGEISLLRTASQKSEWTNELLRLPFERGAIFLFVLPD